MVLGRHVPLLLLLVFVVVQSRAQDDKIINNRVIEIFHDCTCVKYTQCDKDNYIIEDGETLIEERRGEDRIKCEGGKFDGESVCCKVKPDLDITQKNPLDPTTEIIEKKIECGMQRTIINDRIFYVDESAFAVPGEFPWIAAMFTKNANNKYDFSFSGSLIHPKVVLTAAHKLRRIREGDLKVILNGEVERPAIGKNSSEERNVEKIIRHEEFHNTKLFNDVALLILDEPYVVSENRINRICMPPDNVNLEGVQCVVAGWGKENKKDGENVTKKVIVPFVEHNKCQEMLRKTRLGQRFRLNPTFICAGGEKDKDACKGDGGSPLMCSFSPGESRFFQAGIVVGGVGCGQENVPGIYADVGKAKEWIVNKLLDEDITLE